jgi:hypothetical protein
MSSAQYSYPTFTHLAVSEYIPVSGREPPILIGSDVVADGFVAWPETGDVANTIANETSRTVTMPFFIFIPSFLENC